MAMPTVADQFTSVYEAVITEVLFKDTSDCSSCWCSHSLCCLQVAPQGQSSMTRTWIQMSSQLLAQRFLLTSHRLKHKQSPQWEKMREVWTIWHHLIDRKVHVVKERNDRIHQETKTEEHRRRSWGLKLHCCVIHLCYTPVPTFLFVICTFQYQEQQECVSLLLTAMTDGARAKFRAEIKKFSQCEQNRWG